MIAAFRHTMMEMLAMSLITIVGVIFVIYVASRRRPSIKRVSDAALRRMYARGEIDAATYEEELARRRRPGHP